MLVLFVFPLVLSLFLITLLIMMLFGGCVVVVGCVVRVAVVFVSLS